MAAKDKAKTHYVCSDCNTSHPKWTGQCQGCQAWNTLVEQVIAAAPKGAAARAAGRSGYAGVTTAEVTTLAKVKSEKFSRIDAGFAEFNRVLGGGLVPGSCIVLGGNPGAGKSTLLLQSVCSVAKDLRVLYANGEESLQQTKDRATRLGLPQDRAEFMCETNVLDISAMAQELQVDLLVVDSIQTLYHPELESAPGTITQVRECAAELNRMGKRTGICVLMVGHITKNEALAGPNALKHIVDAVLMLSSTDDETYRVLRADKNRFGSTAEIGLFRMTGNGMEEVPNPSSIFLSRTITDAPGSVITPLYEGSRPLLVEIQALVDDTAMPNPRRLTVGIDSNRVSMLLAVLNKHLSMPVQAQDVYVNVVGGLKVADPSADLAVLMAAISSFRDFVVPENAMVFGEITLSGEVRPCANGQERVKEAAKLGFTTAVIPLKNVPVDPVPGLEIVPVTTIVDALAWLAANAVRKAKPAAERAEPSPAETKAAA